MLSLFKLTACITSVKEHAVLPVNILLRRRLVGCKLIAVPGDKYFAVLQLKFVKCVLKLSK